MNLYELNFAKAKKVIDVFTHYKDQINHIKVKIKGSKLTSNERLYLAMLSIYINRILNLVVAKTPRVDISSELLKTTLLASVEGLVENFNDKWNNNAALTRIKQNNVTKEITNKIKTIVAEDESVTPLTDQKFKEYIENKLKILFPGLNPTKLLLAKFHVPKIDKEIISKLTTFAYDILRGFIEEYTKTYVFVFSHLSEKEAADFISTDLNFLSGLIFKSFRETAILGRVYRLVLNGIGGPIINVSFQPPPISSATRFVFKTVKYNMKYVLRNTDEIYNIIKKVVMMKPPADNKGKKINYQPKSSRITDISEKLRKTRSLVPTFKTIKVRDALGNVIKEERVFVNTGMSKKNTQKMKIDEYRFNLDLIREIIFDEELWKQDDDGGDPRLNRMFIAQWIIIRKNGNKEKTEKMWFVEFEDYLLKNDVQNFKELGGNIQYRYKTLMDDQFELFNEVTIYNNKDSLGAVTKRQSITRALKRRGAKDAKKAIGDLDTKSLSPAQIISSKKKIEHKADKVAKDAIKDLDNRLKILKNPPKKSSRDEIKAQAKKIKDFFKTSEEWFTKYGEVIVSNIFDLIDIYVNKAILKITNLSLEDNHAILPLDKRILVIEEIINRFIYTKIFGFTKDQISFTRQDKSALKRWSQKLRSTIHSETQPVDVMDISNGPQPSTSTSTPQLSLLPPPATTPQPSTSTPQLSLLPPPPTTPQPSTSTPQLSLLPPLTLFLPRRTTPALPQTATTITQPPLPTTQPPPALLLPTTQPPDDDDEHRKKRRKMSLKKGASFGSHMSMFHDDDDDGDWDKDTVVTRSILVAFYSIDNDGKLLPHRSCSVDLVKLFHDTLTFDEIIFSKIQSLEVSVLNRAGLDLSLLFGKVKASIGYNNYDRGSYGITEHSHKLGHFSLNKNRGLNGTRSSLNFDDDDDDNGRFIGSDLYLDTINSIQDIDAIIAKKRKENQLLLKTQISSNFDILERRHTGNQNNSAIQLFSAFKNRLSKCHLILENQPHYDDRPNLNILQAEIFITLKKTNSSAMYH